MVARSCGLSLQQLVRGEFDRSELRVAVQREADVGDRYALGEESLFISGLDRQQVVCKSGAVNVGVASLYG